MQTQTKSELTGGQDEATDTLKEPCIMKDYEEAYSPDRKTWCREDIGS